MLSKLLGNSSRPKSFYTNKCTTPNKYTKRTYFGNKLNYDSDVNFLVPTRFVAKSMSNFEDKIKSGTNIELPADCEPQIYHNRMIKLLKLFSEIKGNVVDDIVIKSVTSNSASRHYSDFNLMFFCFAVSQVRCVRVSFEEFERLSEHIPSEYLILTWYYESEPEILYSIKSVFSPTPFVMLVTGDFPDY